jgi:hypothetical protein
MESKASALAAAVVQRIVTSIRGTFRQQAKALNVNNTTD